MLNNIGAFITVHALLFSASATVAILAFLYIKRHSWFWLTDLLYTVPIIGRLSRYSNDYSMSDHSGWRNVERTLCRDYGAHIAHLSPQEFDQNITYLNRAHDHGRKPLAGWIIAALLVLVVLEGAGFAFLLSPLIAADSSEDVRLWLMLAIVLAMSGVLLWVTHAAGHQLYRTRLLVNCFREFQASGKERYTTRIVSLSEDQQTDDQEPDHVQCANRVIAFPGDRGSYAWSWFAAVLIASIAIGSIVIREDHRIVSSSQEAAATAGALGRFDNAGSATTPAAPDPRLAAAESEGATVGFSMLAVIFVFTQFVGISVGYKYGFAGRESGAAYAATRGHGRYQSYFEPIQRRINIANARLDKLRQKLEAAFPGTLTFGGCFRDYLDDERKRDGDFHSAARRSPPVETPAAGAGRGEAPTPAGPPDLKLVIGPVDIALEKLEAMSDRESKVAYLKDLPDEVRMAVAERLRAKAEALLHESAVRKQFDGILWPRASG